jgi:hypothetical protein
MSQENEWIESEKELPNIGENVEYSEDGVIAEGTLDYTDRRHCMLAFSSAFGRGFGEGFATDGHNGCDTGLVCDAPRYWRRYN